jgi:hypothetical protein
LWKESSNDLAIKNIPEESRTIYEKNSSLLVYCRSSILQSSSRSGNNPTTALDNVGFRVAGIPEPSTALLGALEPMDF